MFKSYEFKDLSGLVHGFMTTPKKHQPSLFISYQHKALDIHVTALFWVLPVSEVKLGWELFNEAKRTLGTAIKVRKIGLSKISSARKPDAVIYDVSVSRQEKWSVIHRKVVGYPWKPHVTMDVDQDIKGPFYVKGQISYVPYADYSIYIKRGGVLGNYIR